MPQSTTPPSTPPAEPQRAAFRDIARIDDVDKELGLFAVITERESDGKISFCIFRGFDRVVNGKSRPERSTYLGQKHIPAYHRLLKEVDRRLDQMEERARGERRAAAGEPHPKAFGDWEP